MARVQITVRGAGIFGLSIAYETARRGAAVHVIDTQGIAAGSSGGFVGAIAPYAPDDWQIKKAFQLDSLLMADGFWAGVSAAANLPTGYARLGRLQSVAGARAVEVARLRQEAALRHWAGHAVWHVRPSTGAKWEPISPSGFVIEDTLSARIDPRLATRALAGAISALGGKITIGEAPDQGAVIWATGVAGLEALSQHFGRKIGGGVKGQAVLLRYEARDLPQISGDSLHIVPHSDGTVAVGSTSENEWDQPDTTDARLDALLARAIAVLPALKDAPVLARWAGIRPRSMSLAPILGAWPNRDGHFIANGGFKIGFGMAPKVAQVMADLVLDGRDTIPQTFHL